MTKIKNISAVQTPMPLTAVSASDDRLVVPGVVEFVERDLPADDGLGQVENIASLGTREPDGS